MKEIIASEVGVPPLIDQISQVSGALRVKRVKTQASIPYNLLGLLNILG